MFETARLAAEIISEEGLSTLTDSGEIERVCREVIEKNPENAAKFRAGNEGMFKFFVGQAMRATRGQADPQAINQTLRRLLAS
jgi:aspartyl-tRNA(Asn)/glutamyl-tRNA(Gln) amidotransferase subunit B